MAAAGLLYNVTSYGSIHSARQISNESNLKSISADSPRPACLPGGQGTDKALPWL